MADVGIGDFDGDGAADVVAAEFGWLSTGSVDHRKRVRRQSRWL